MKQSLKQENRGLSGFIDLEPTAESFVDTVLAGLARPQKSIPSKFFYDRRGSELFEEICRLDEYYPTRTEIKILTERSGEIAALMGPRTELIEFGSGASEKVRVLLEALDRPLAYIPIDISRDHLRAAAEELAVDYPEVEVIAVCADYSQTMTLPEPRDHSHGKRVGFFPGSTIGNFTPAEAVEFLKNAAKTLGPGGEFLIGVDLKKDPAILHAAYNDKKGVTAAFNLNLLRHINNELQGTFELDAFAHKAFYNEECGRIEMHLESLKDQNVMVAGAQFHFSRGETIHTENSCKYSIEEFQELARRGGFDAMKFWTDENNLFSLHYLKVRQILES